MLRINMTCKYDMTALMYAAQHAQHGRTEIAELLLKNGAHFNSRNNDALLTIMLAEIGGHKEIAQLLRSYVAK